MLEDRPPEFAELRATHVKEQEWRVRDGLVQPPNSTIHSSERGIALVTGTHNVRNVAKIEGISVADSDAWWIADQLHISGRADDVTAAYAIHLGIISDRDVSLNPAQREAVRLALVNAPRGLIELHAELARDHHDRH